MTIIYCFNCYLLSISILVVLKYPVINGSTIAEVQKLTELNCEAVVLSKDDMHNIFFVMCTLLCNDDQSGPLCICLATMVIFYLTDL